MMGGTLLVEAAGPATTVQDLGRPGAAALGVSPSGALDRGALCLANRLVGNPEGRAALEVVLGPFAAVPDVDLWIAVTGAWGPITVDGRPSDGHRAVRVQAGSRLELGVATHGLRYVLAVRGGFDGPQVLGSRSTDTLAGLGPAPVVAGDRLPVLPTPRRRVPPLDIAPWTRPDAGERLVRVSPGPRRDWFDDASRQRLVEQPWTITADADRIGMRLDGPPLERLDPGRELPSEGMVAGAVQVPPSGLPTILSADHPVTGGYPVIAVVRAADRDLLAQLRPGQRLRFSAS
ncbi:biotin-dependent carboxyltransferase family protein [Plantibacter sp. VKM Ac-2876]|uniref:5-oxoprolinase subunit C family protein n=1 Tax=Plantibacter sp. VKM Ac-2876 TaxID=2783826 RepID=UPI00188D59A0|nr:biotin-dependent carboxyltransferase family protein [Plantibacter sp. VKM Ac-2876]MBF4565862.1 biotin-dependent carboxyltransferase family protein [Plantibacter sp. VKM Ac-2876]